MKQCWPAVFPKGWFVGWPGLARRGWHVFTAWLWMSSLSAFVSCYWAVLTYFHPHPAHFSWHGKYVVNILVSTDFQCDGAWWLPLTGLSWIPYMFSSACFLAPPWLGPIPQVRLLFMGLDLGLLLDNVNIMLKSTQWHIACNECVVFLLWIGSIFQTLELKTVTTLKIW